MLLASNETGGFPAVLACATIVAKASVHFQSAAGLPQDIKITGCTVFVDPYKEEVEAEVKAEAEAAEKVRIWPVNGNRIPCTVLWVLDKFMNSQKYGCL